MGSRWKVSGQNLFRLPLAIRWESTRLSSQLERYRCARGANGALPWEGDASGRSAGTDVAMAALMPTKYEDAVALCEIVRKKLLENGSSSNSVCCDVANYNAFNQVVVSGTQEAVERVVQIGKELRHVRRATILEVSAPFHSTMMKQAREMFEPILWETKFKVPAVPIVSNVDGHAYQQEVSTHVYKKLLLDQMSSTVQWVPMMELCRNGGFQEFIEFTPKPTLGPLIQKHIS